MLNWAILGLGKIAETRVAPAFAQAPGNRLVAMAGRYPARTAAFAARHDVRPAIVAEVCADPAIDAVYVAAANDHHLPYTLAAAAAGKHVLCEKPLARTPEEAAQMVAACRTAGVRLGTAFMMRFHPAHVQIRDLIAAGELGTIYQARAQFAFELSPARRTWRLDATAGGGPLLDVGSHAIDLISYVTGLPVRAVSALQAVQTFAERSAEDAAVGNLLLGERALAQVNVAFNTPYAVTGLEVHGSAGSARTLGTLGQTAEGRAELRTAAGGRDLTWERCDLYAAEIAAFAAAVADGTPLAISGEAGLANLIMLAAAAESARWQGVLVPVPA